MPPENTESFKLQANQGSNECIHREGKHQIRASRDNSLCYRGETCLERTFGNLWLNSFATMKAKYITSEWYPFNQVYVHESESTPPIPLLTTTSGVPVATTEGAELLGITADKLVMACRRGTL